MSVTAIHWTRRSNGRTEVIVDGEKLWAKVLPLSTVRNILENPNLNKRPQSQEDWKAIVWLFDGPKPSHVENVKVEIFQGHAILIWRVKHGIQQIKEGIG